MIDPGIVARYRKVLVHAQRGEGNERTNAQRTLDKMEAKYPGVGAQARQDTARDEREKATADWARRVAHAAHAANATRAQAVRHATYPSTGPNSGPDIPPADVAFWFKFVQDAIEDAATVGGPPPSAKLFVQSFDFGQGFVANLKRKTAEWLADRADDQIATRIAALRASGELPPARGNAHQHPDSHAYRHHDKRGSTMALTEKEVIARLEDEGIEAFHCTDDDNGDELIQLNILIPLEVWEGIKEHPAAFFAAVEEQLEADDDEPEEEGGGDPEELDGDLDEGAEAPDEDEP
jgi:hypothetical protein